MKKNSIINSKNIILLGLVSMFVDMSTEMVYPIIPLFLATLGTAPYLIGLIEGVAESIAALLKSFAGYFTDKYNSKKMFAVSGYLLSAVYKIGLILSSTWIGVLISRIIDRTGKGLRTAPRDSLIAESGGKKLGRSFGLHKMLDMLGSGLGVLIAYIILTNNYNFKSVILVSVIPALIGVCILFFVKEKKKVAQANEKVSFKLKDIKLSKKLVMYLGVVFLFSIGNFSNVFLLLKAQNHGFDTQSVLLLYLLFNLTASFFSIPAGKFSDKFGRRSMVVPSYFLYGVIYFGFAIFDFNIAYILLFFLYGVYTAMISGAERALLVEMSPDCYKGTVLGLYGSMQGFGLLLSSTFAGLLWSFAGNNTPFFAGGILAIVSAFLILFLKIGSK